MEGEKTQKFQTRERIPISVLLFPHPIPYIISISENLSDLPCGTAARNTFTILQTHTTRRPFRLYSL